MKPKAWERDKMPYLIFSCKKCKQFLYVKTTQKTKKCLRCGFTHQVKNILNSGETINGMTKAMETVKERQNDLALKELGSEPDLRTVNDFQISSNYPREITKSPGKTKKKLSSSQKFREVLIKLSGMYTTFPSYMIEIMCEEYNIPKYKLEELKKKLIRENSLRELRNNYYLYKT